METRDIRNFNINIPQNPLFLQKPKNETPKIEGETFEKSGAPDENSSLIINKMQAKDIGEKTEAEKPREFPFTPQWENKSNPDGTKEVTVLFYANGQNNLSGFNQIGIAGMETVHDSKDVNVIVQFGEYVSKKETGGPHNVDPKKNKSSDVRRYDLKKVHRNNADTLAVFLDVEKKIPQNPLLMHEIGMEYWEKDERTEAKQYFDKARELGYSDLFKENCSEEADKFGFELAMLVNERMYPTSVEKNTIKSPVLEKLPEDTQMENPKVLEDFVQWGMKKYPAKHYMLVIQDHGGAWQGAVENPHLVAKAIENGVAESNKETGKNDHIDALIFNSCYMGNAEAINEMKNCADITVASENYASATSFTDWNHFIQTIEKNISEGKPFDGKKFTSDMVDYYREESKYIKDNLLDFEDHLTAYRTLTSVDNKKIGDLTESWKKFNQACKKEGVTDQQLFTAVNNAKNYPSDAPSRIPFFYHHIRDMGGIMDEINKIDVPDSVKKAADGVKEALKSVIINEQHEGGGMEGSSGLSVWGPVDYDKVEDLAGKYTEFVPDFAKNSGWLDRLQEASSNVPAEVKKAFIGKKRQTIALSSLSNMQKLSERDKKNLQDIGILTKEEQKRFAEISKKSIYQLYDLQDTDLPPKEKQMVNTLLKMYKEELDNVALVLCMPDSEKEFVKNSLGLSDQEADNLHTLTSFTQEQKVKYDKAMEDLKRFNETTKFYADRS